MANEMFSMLPTVTNATTADVICAVQGGVSVQETLGQVGALFQSGIILTYPGNPNGNLAGTIYQFCWDSTDKFLWICTTTGSISGAVWTPCIGALTNGQTIIGNTNNVPAATTLTAGTNISINNSAGGITISATGMAGIGWTNVTSGSQVMIAGSGYVSDNSSLVTFTLPATAAFGTLLYVQGFGAGGWQINVGSGQTINIGNASCTISTGNISSSDYHDSIALLCVTANTNWSALGAPQGNITVV